MKTYLTFYQNEIRAIELEIRDQNDDAYNPTTAYAWVYNSDGVTVVTEGPCMVTANKVYVLIGEGVTNTPGEYDVVWRIMKSGDNGDSYRFFHKTRLTVEEL